jgi:predicted nucleic acid-binding Zn ribbon protein
MPKSRRAEARPEICVLFLAGGAMAKTSDADHIGQILAGLVQRFRPEVAGGMLEVWQVWDAAVGPEIARNARPVAFKGKTLLVYVASSAWLHHLHFLKADLLSRLNSELGKPMVAQIKFKVGSL